MNAFKQFFIYSFLIAASLISSTHLSAQTVAVLDTGVDLEHPHIKQGLRLNLLERANGLDSDGNDYIDDLCGWNFADHSPLVFDSSQRSRWPHEVYQYYWIRMLRSFNTWSASEEEWYLSQRRDSNFRQIQSQFSSINHGTHVAAIALNGPVVNPAQAGDLPIPAPYQLKLHSQASFKLLPIKYLGDDSNSPWPAPVLPKLPSDLSASERLQLFDKFLSLYEQWQLEKLERAVAYAASFEDVRVINGSFGKSYTSTETQISRWLKRAGLQRELAAQFTQNFLARLNRGVAHMAQRYDHILFTFSAGNSDQNIDRKPHYPSGAGAANTISVGASLWYSDRAYFSNYGAQSVDLFAPGLAILSAATPDLELPINGTSQAAPYIAHLALQLIHPQIKSARIYKQIILGTVDQKDSLAQMARSSGIVNARRAMRARELYLSGHDLTQAIALAHQEIGANSDITLTNAKSLFPLSIEALPEAF